MRFEMEDDVPVGPFPALARIVALIGEGEILRGLNELGVVIEFDDEDLRPRAVLLLGRLNEARGDVAGMLAAYQTAADSGHPEVAPFAALLLGDKLLDAAQYAPARRAFKQAATAQDPKVRQVAESVLQALPRRGRPR